MGSKTTDPQALLEHATWLRGLARSLVGDGAVDDVVQETWLAGLRRPPETDRSVRPWLRTVARNVARLRWRSDANRTAREHAAAAVGEREAPSSGELLERHETQQLLARLVGELDEPFRTTILLRFAEGLTPSEIARKLELPASTVRWRLKEALDRLRVQLDAAHRGDRRAWIAAVAPLAGPMPSASSPAAASPAAAIVLGIVALACLVTGLLWLTSSRREQTASAGSASRAHAAKNAAAHVSADSTTGRIDIANPPGWLSQEGAPSRRLAGHVLVDGVPMPGVLVRLTSELSDVGLAPVREQRSGMGGRFDFGEQIPRGYVLSAAAPAKLAAIRHVDLRDPTTASDVELALIRCSASYYGKVSDSVGTPIAHAQVLREGVIGAETDATGSYELCVLQSSPILEQLRLVVRAEGYGTIAIDRTPAGRVRRDFVLTPEAVIAGSARSASGTPVEHAKVWVEPDIDDTRAPSDRPAAVAAITDAEGRFRIAGVSAGRHRLSAAGRSTTGGPLDITVAAGETREISFVMNATGIVRGRVVQASQPVAGVRIATLQPPWLMRTADAGDDAVSQADGSFVLDRVPLGKVRLATSPHALRSPTEVTVVEGDRNETTIEVGPLGSLRGTVRRHGVPIPLAHVLLTGVGRDLMGAIADSGGQYEITGIEPAEYTVQAIDSAQRSFGVQTVTLALAEQRVLDLELTFAASIAGVVVNGRGDPVAAVIVKFENGQGDRAVCVTGADGRFDCGGLEGGSSYTPSVLATPVSQMPFTWLAPAPPVALADADARVDGVKLVVDPVVASITGTVIDTDGNPVLEARVNAFVKDRQLQQPPPASGYTDTDGRFRIADLGAGNYDLEAQTFDRGRSAHRVVAAGTSGVTLVVEAARCDADGVHDEPRDLTGRPSAPVVWDRSIELVGWRTPRTVTLGKPFEVTFVYRVLQPVQRPWKIFTHVDGPVKRRNADHDPADGHCPTSTWHAGDVIVDRFTTTIDPKWYGGGTYTIWTGFFAGWPPTFRNLTVSEAPDALRGTADLHPNAIRVTDLVVE